MALPYNPIYETPGDNPCISSSGDLLHDLCELVCVPSYLLRDGETTAYSSTTIALEQFEQRLYGSSVRFDAQDREMRMIHGTGNDKPKGVIEVRKKDKLKAHQVKTAVKKAFGRRMF